MQLMKQVAGVTIVSAQDAGAPPLHEDPGGFVMSDSELAQQAVQHGEGRRTRGVRGNEVQVALQRTPGARECEL